MRGGRAIRHARDFSLQFAEGHLTGLMFRQILGRIEQLAWHPTRPEPESHIRSEDDEASKGDRLAVPGRVRQQIIVIEANDGAREMLRVEPTHEGHKVHEAAYGPTGVDGAAAVAPGAPLIDVGLSDLDDCDVARRMRAGKGEMSARLTATTGYGSAEDRRRAKTGSGPL